MKYYLILILCLSSPLCFAADEMPSETKIMNSGPVQKVVPSKKMIQVLKKWDSTAKIVSEKSFERKTTELFSPNSEEVPMGQKVDLTGDGFEDYAFVVETKDDYKFIAVIVDSNRYDVFTLESLPKKDFSKGEKLTTYLSVMPENKLKFKLGSKKRPAIQVETYLGPTRAYYFNGDKFVRYVGKAI